MTKQALLLVLLTSLAVLSHGGVGSAAEWLSYVNAEVGYRIRYPAGLFREVKPDDPHHGVILDAPDEQAVLYVFGGPNEHRRNASELAADLSFMDDIHRVTYTRVASKWFVLSGFLKRSEPTTR
jgi:hypothetical protein